ncbi:MAG: GNAT family protein [Candidatus Nanohaloarchaea archaeon]|nr:GNAT family protein [Candidatus Nanohaloarchaea archaeon]
MDRAPFLQTDSLDLLPIERDDLERLRDILNHPEVRVPVNNHEPLNMADEEDWFEQERDKDDIHLVLHHREDSEVIGLIGLEVIDQRSRVAETGFFIHPDYHSRGLGSEALSTVLDYGFSELNLHRIYANVLDFNDKSAGLLEKHGFSMEGTLREHAYVDGEYRDTLKYGLLRSEWEHRHQT